MIGVVVPVHNEEEMLSACLASLLLAARHPNLERVPVHIVVVLDACTDSSWAVAQQLDVDVLNVAFTNVGRARHAGACWLIARGAQWLAFTDGDTTVGPDWLVHHYTSQADAICGGVQLSDWSKLPRQFRQRYLAHRAQVAGGRHIHGANLGISVTAYRAIGGFAPLVAHEDVRLIGALQQRGYTIEWLHTMQVKTSSRRDARAPEGLGALLRSLG